MITLQQNINLTLPRRWNECSTEQLEMIARIFIEQTERIDRYHPFSMLNVKVATFIVLTEIEVLRYPDESQSSGEQHYLCRRLSDRPRGLRLLHNSNEEGAFPLYVWQLQYWLSPKRKTRTPADSPEALMAGDGLLDWLDSDSPDFLTRFAYPTLHLRRRGRFSKRKEFRGPMPDLDGFSWQQYRFASDLMQQYVSLSNNLLRMRTDRRFSLSQLIQQAENVGTARAMFLATIFNAPTEYIDTNTGIRKKDFHYELSQHTDNKDYFIAFPEYQWQVILFWWTGITHTLAKRYPHVFKSQKIDSRKAPSTALEIYTATIATMQKYTGLDEDKLNNQSYSLVLEHLERLSKENEEIEKIRKK